MNGNLKMENIDMIPADAPQEEAAAAPAQETAEVETGEDAAGGDRDECGAEADVSGPVADGETLPAPEESVPAEQLLIDAEDHSSDAEARLRAILEAVIYVTDEPLSLAQISAAIEQPREKEERLLDELVAEYSKPIHGITVREVAGGYKMTTKPEHHESIRAFVKNLKPPLKLSLAALETLAVIAYKQPITTPEIMEIRGVQGAGVLKTLLDRKLITTAGRKAVVGKPILYKTSKEFLIQFGLKDLGELPSLKEFEELARLALVEQEAEPAVPGPLPDAEAAPENPPEPAEADESGAS